MAVLVGSLLMGGAIPDIAQAAAAGKPKPKAPAVTKEKKIPFTRATPGKGRAEVPFAKYDPRVASKLPGAGSAVVDLTSASSPASSVPASADAAKSVLVRTEPKPVRAGDLPVLLKPAAGSKGPAASAAGGPSAGAPSKVRVSVADQKTAQAAGVHGVLFSVGAEGAGGADAGPGGSTVVTVDPSSFGSAFGGDYAARLRLVRLPACALTTPALPACQVQTPVETVEGSALSAEVSLATAPARAEGSAKATGSAPAEGSSAKSSLTNSPAAAPMAAPPSGSSGATVLAATSAPDGAAGSYSATSLSPAGTWSGGGSTGALNYSYPVKVPTAIGGSTPDVSLGYDSSSQDGRTSGTNNQSSWVGDGWSSNESFIERTYKGCADDKTSGAPVGALDRCWAGQVLTLSLNGSSTQIVYDGTTFRPAADSATEKVERLFLSGGAANGTYNGEYFRVTENGVQYYFGLNRLPGFTSGKQETNSVFTVPVYGAHTGDPCHAATYAASSCVQGYRWNLDYVVDTHDNAIAYYYAPETNYYGANGQNTGVAYTRGGHLSRIDYGMTASTVYAGTAPEQIVFEVTERCVPGSPAGAVCDDAHFTAANASWWPDVPLDQNCAQGASCTSHGPSFWSRKRLASITTQVQVGGATQQVDKYSFAQSFPDGGDHAPTLWLSNIKRTGLDTSAGGGDELLSLPVTSFDPPAQKPNRVGTITNQAVMYHDRIQNIVTETGAQITVTYNPAECTPANVPSDPAANTKACFPVLWIPPGYSTQQKDWFHKYTVASVRTDDLRNANQDGTYPTQLTSYKYVGGAAWHYDDGEFTKSEDRTYSQFRGYGAVETRSGDTSVFHTTNGAKVNDQLSLTVSRFFRGMSRNTLDGTGGTVVNLTSQDGKYSVEDRNEFAGRVFESDTYTRDGGTISSATVTEPTVIGPTATRARTGLRPLNAQMIRDGAVHKREAVSYGWRETENATFYNTTLGQPTTGMPVQAADRGEPTAAGNLATCTWTRYAVNEAKAMALPAEIRTNAQDCPTAGATQSGAVITDSRTSYDGNAFTWYGSGGGTAPTKGEPTLSEVASAASGATASAFVAVSRTSYDSYGRAVTTVRTPDSTAPDGSSLAQSTTTTYTPAAGALPTGVETKYQVTAGATPTFHTSTATLSAARGLPLEKTDPANLRTSLTYDSLGRSLAVWLPTQSKAAGQQPTMKYSYAVSATGPSSITSLKLLENGSYSSSVTLYDALLRSRQTQVTAENSSMTVSDTQYDSHGWTVLTNNAYNVAGAPGTGLVSVAQINVPATTVTDHDAMGRATSTQEEHNGVTTPGMTTATVHTGDSVLTVPMSGGIVSREVTNARGQKTEVHQYATPPTLTGSATAGWTATGGTSAVTKYGYTGTGKPSTVTAADNTVWTSTYDLLDRKVGQSDPDAGTSTYTFDDAGNQVTSTDARGTELNFTYDLLGRKLTAVDKTNGNFKFGVWKYDTLQAGKLTYSARYVPGVTGAYVNQVTGYTSLGNPTGTKITLPASEAPLPTTYTTSLAYSPTTQQLISQRDPGVAGLLTEDITYGYNVLGRPLSAQSVNAYVGPIAYTNYGEVAQLTYGPSNNPAWSTYSYDDQTRQLNRVQTSRYQSPGPVVDDITYTYDASGNPVSTVDKQSETGATTTDTQCYQYDAMRRLAQAWTAKGACPAAGVNPTAATVATGPAAYWQSFSYDVIGNRVGSVEHAVNGQAGDTTTTYTNGCTGNATQCPGGAQPHTLTKTATTGPSGSGSTSYTFGKTGATTDRKPSSGAAQSLTWDSEGRLATITEGTNVTKYVYDADGTQLIRRDVGQGRTTLFVGDTQIVVNTSVTPNVLLGATRTYTLGGKAVAMASSMPGGGVNYMVVDPHNTLSLTMETGTQKAVRKQYTPYGQERGTSTGWPDPTRGFLGMPVSPTTGYTDVGARKYDPALGRFISADPVFDPNDPQQLGGYTYASSNPVGNSDPTGLRTDDGPDNCDAACVAQNIAIIDAANEETERYFARRNKNHISNKACSGNTYTKVKTIGYDCAPAASYQGVVEAVVTPYLAGDATKALTPEDIVNMWWAGAGEQTPTLLFGSDSQIAAMLSSDNHLKEIQKELNYAFKHGGLSPEGEWVTENRSGGPADNGPLDAIGAFGLEGVDLKGLKYGPFDASGLAGGLWGSDGASRVDAVFGSYNLEYQVVKADRVDKKLMVNFHVKNVTGWTSFCHDTLCDNIPGKNIPLSDTTTGRGASITQHVYFTQVYDMNRTFGR
ncbi:RHS repeat domain-containing protein [Streptomyces sp. NPDC054956]